MYIKHPSPTIITYKISTIMLFLPPKFLTSLTNLTNSLMTVSLYIDFLLNFVHLNLLSPLSPMKNYHSYLTNLSTRNFPPSFPPFPPLAFPSLPSPFLYPLQNLNLPHLIKSSPFSNLPPQPHPLTLFPYQY